MKNVATAAVKSWRTTLAGVSLFVSVLAAALHAHFDGNPATVADWAMLVPAGSAMLAFVFSRDNVVTSAQAGAGK